MRVRLWIVLLVGAILAPLTGSPASTAAGTSRDCHRVVVSPTYERDHTLYCLGALYAEDRNMAVVQISKDRGLSWAPFPTEGLNSRDVSLAVDLVLLPREDTSSDFGTSNDVYVRFVHGEDRGLYVTSDEGETWSLADKVLGEPLIRSLDSYTDTSVTPTGWIVYPGASPGRTVPPVHVPVAGSPELDEFFVFPPRFPAEGSVLSLGSSDTSPSDNVVHFSQVSVYRCDGALTCNDKRFTFPDRMFVRGYYVNDRVAYFSGIDHGDPLGGDDEKKPARVWWSRDGAETVSPWRSINKVLAGRWLSSSVRIVESERRQGIYFMLVPDADELYRSADAGKSWTRIRHRPRLTDMHALVATVDGRLFLTASHEDGQRVFCSVDQARTWKLGCKR